MESRQRLARSESNKVLGGVCGGLGQYLGVDPILVRLFFILLVVAEGAGLLIYLLLWLIMPREHQVATAGLEENVRAAGQKLKTAVGSGNAQGAVVVGAGLILFGLFFLLRNLDWMVLRWLDFGLLWPIIFILAGMALLWQRLKLQS